MNRKQFIESHGATCSNWTWSWSFINKKEKVIIFGAWDLYTKGNLSLILSEDWTENWEGRKQPGYEQSREHIRLIEEEGYQLKTFPIKHSQAHEEENGPSKIESFIEKLTNKTLKKIGNGWHASDGEISDLLPEEVSTPEQFTEGTSNTITVNTYERNTDARAKCIEFHGYKCSVCNFDFEKTYGSVGEKYIHVHHIIPLSEIKEKYVVDPIKDLIPVCPNCHAIIHRTTPALTVAQLQGILEDK